MARIHEDVLDPSFAPDYGSGRMETIGILVEMAFTCEQLAVTPPLPCLSVLWGHAPQDDLHGIPIRATDLQALSNGVKGQVHGTECRFQVWRDGLVDSALGRVG